MINKYSYKLIKSQEHIKSGRITTPHGVINTPVFMPVGTKASVKSVSPDDLKDMQAQIVLGNTYHLYLRPGVDVVEEVGGLHEFMRWNRPILTDSGGYQVSSLGWFKNKGERKLSKIDDAGVTFYSHIDGLKQRLEPAKVIRIQSKLGADIIMAFDEATPNRGKRYAEKAMKRTHEWLDECVAEWNRIEKKKTKKNELKQSLFGIIQGGDFRDLRRLSAEYVVSKDLPGVAIGGATIGQSVKETEKNVSWVRDLIPMDKPLYLMGVGVSPEDVIGAVKSGADMFDCVAPTKIARSGLLYNGKLKVRKNDVSTAKFESEFSKQRINLGNRRYIKDNRVIDDNCDCYTCVSGFTRSYLRHLYKSRELFFYRLASIHNLRVLVRIVDELREMIRAS